jgi:hypothetical protein
MQRWIEKRFGGPVSGAWRASSKKPVRYGRTQTNSLGRFRFRTCYGEGKRRGHVGLMPPPSDAPQITGPPPLRAGRRHTAGGDPAGRPATDPARWPADVRESRCICTPDSPLCHGHSWCTWASSADSTGEERKRETWRPRCGLTAPTLGRTRPGREAVTLCANPSPDGRHGHGTVTVDYCVGCPGSDSE